MVKFYPPMIRSDFDAEVEVRSALGTCGSAVPFPRMVASGILQDRLEWAYIVEEFRPGLATRDVWAAMSRSDRDDVAIQVAGILRDLHSTPLALLPTLRLSAAEWRERARQRVREFPSELAGAEMLPGQRLPECVIEELNDFVSDRADGLIDSVSESSLRLLHNDMTEDHVLVERGKESTPSDKAMSSEAPGGWQVSALIDYGDAKVGPVEEEWVVLWVGCMMQDPAALRAFLGAYGNAGTDVTADPASPAFQEKVLTFTLLHRFNWAIIREVVRRSGVKPASLTSLESLQAIMWPPG